jgi:tetratricopeptide (TPR) repeat protein
MVAKHMLGLMSVAWLLTPHALGDPTLNPGDAGPPQIGLARLIEDLGSESFEVREAATAALWGRGKDVLGPLQEAASSPDPEVSFRARDLVRKIELGVGPETSPEVRKLVEEYQASDRQKKLALIGRLIREKAYRQVLRLYALEKDADARAILLEVIVEVAPAAARQALQAGDPDEALSLLRMAPRNDRGLANLAAFHRARGTLSEELKRAAAEPGEAGQQWRLALHRAAGNIDAALTEALALKREATVAGLLLLQGDPVPWLELQTKGDDVTVFQHLYVKAAVQQWKTNTIEPGILDEMARTARQDGDEELRFFGISGLFALGEVARGEALMATGEIKQRVGYLDQAERTDEALEAFGLDPLEPDYPAWAAKQVAAIDKDNPEVTNTLILTLARFLHQRGDLVGFRQVIDPLLALHKEDPEILVGILASLHSAGVFLAILPDVEAYVAAANGPNATEGRWAEVVETFYGEDPVVLRWWQYLGAGANPLAPRERLRTLNSLFGGMEEPRLAGPWVERRWKEAQAAIGAERESAMEMLVRVTCPTVSRSGGHIDLQMAIQVLAEINKMGSIEDYAKLYMHLLSVDGRWEEAATFCRALMREQPSRLDLGQELAMFLKKSGARQESQQWLERSELLAFGNPVLLLTLAGSHQNIGDYEKAPTYLRQILIENDPGTPAWMEAITGVDYDVSLPQVSGLAEHSLSRRDWALAAALQEVVTLNLLNGNNMYLYPANSKLLPRLTANLARGMRDHLAGKTKQADAIIRRAGQFCPGQGTLADDFFPALREAKLTKLHDELFELSWAHLQRSIQRYPKAENTYNTLAWISARASRRLDEGEQSVLRAIKERPNAAYLDTYAELHFARNNRAKALEWADKAVAAMPNDAQIIKQRERFRKGDFPPP